jgi:hypothetical protein
MADNRPDRAADPDPPTPQGGAATTTVTAPPAAVGPPPGTRDARTASEAGPVWFMRQTWPKARGSWRQFMRFLANAAVMASVVIAVLFAAHITFVVFKANPGNGIVEFVNAWASRLAWNFRDLFVPHDPRVATLANYGIAAVACLIAGRIAAAIIRRLG